MDVVQRWVWARRLRALAAVALLAVAAALLLQVDWPTSDGTRSEVALTRSERPAQPIAPPPSRDSDTAAPLAPTLEPEAHVADLWAELDAARSQGAWCGGRWLGAVATVDGDGALDEAALVQLEYMSQANDWAHDTPGNPAGVTPSDRAWAAGFDGDVTGEILAWGQGTAEQAVGWWLGSPPHCRALMAPEAELAGVGIVIDPHTDGLAWAVVLGRSSAL